MKRSPDALEQGSSATLSFAALKSEADFLFLDMKVLLGIQ